MTSNKLHAFSSVQYQQPGSSFGIKMIPFRGPAYATKTSVEHRSVVVDTQTFCHLMDIKFRSSLLADDSYQVPACASYDDRYYDVFLATAGLLEAASIAVLPESLTRYAAIKDVSLGDPVLDGLPFGITVIAASHGDDNEVEVSMRSAVLQAVCGSSKNGTEVEFSDSLAVSYDTKLRLLSWAYVMKAVIVSWEAFLDPILSRALEAAGFDSLEYVSMLDDLLPATRSASPCTRDLSLSGVDEHPRRSYKPSFQTFGYVKDRIQSSFGRTLKSPLRVGTAKRPIIPTSMSKDRRSWHRSVPLTRALKDPTPDSSHSDARPLLPSRLKQAPTRPLPPPMSITITIESTKTSSPIATAQSKWLRKERAPLLIPSLATPDTIPTALESCFESDISDTSSIYSPVKSFESPQRVDLSDSRARSPEEEQIVFENKGEDENGTVEREGILCRRQRRNSESSVSVAISKIQCFPGRPVSPTPIPTNSIKVGFVTSHQPTFARNSQGRRMVPYIAET